VSPAPDDEHYRPPVARLWLSLHPIHPEASIVEHNAWYAQKPHFLAIFPKTLSFFAGSNAAVH
jgi:hypothetical protein